MSAEPAPTSRHTKVAVIGSGCAGLTAAIYAARAAMPPIVIEGMASGGPPGGQLALTSEVENYPGFPKGILGPELMGHMRAQAERFGSEFIIGDVTTVDLSRRPFTIDGEGALRFRITCDALIVATGAKPKKLGLVGEREPPEGMWGRGVTSCATCDGMFYRGEDVVVIGGGDTAMEEATYLAKMVRKVTLIHRRAEFRSSKIMLDRARSTANIEFALPYVVEEILPDADRNVRGVRMRHATTGEQREVVVKGFFLGIGHEPNTGVFQGQLQLDENGYIVVGPGAGQSVATATSVPGVFAAGDVADHIYRQAVTAAGTGCQAAIDAERFLAH
ncbi:MAG: thioredoxin-disulfide reductase [Myxococcales bacterium]|nr:thioredoxin-disulfide reductase [Myxococcales bacterium]